MSFGDIREKFTLGKVWRKWKITTEGNSSKCFTYVTKTRANLTTYSRKPENYNGTIIFEIDIMKNSSPINLNLGHTWLFHKFFGCFFCFDLLWSWVESAVSPVLFWHGKECEFWIVWGWVFHDVNLKNNGAIVIPRFFTICG